MERTTLEAWLAEGLSLEAMGERAARAPSTISYWLRKHGLRAANSERHAARGPLPREQLEPLVTRGLSQREIGRELGRSQASVRHWLQEYGLETMRAQRRVIGQGPRALGVCPRHGEVQFGRRADGVWRCLRCRSEAVAERRRRVKRLLVEEAGGRCQLCGYDRCIAALQFHHLDPTTKRFSLAHLGASRSLARSRAEARKCALLCANCHAEVEAGVTSLPLDFATARADDTLVGPG